jgi:tripartite-type tricarboxylate transporter receptor subunit TctC
VAFLGEVETWGGENKTKKLNVLGTSGVNSVRGFPTLASQTFGKNVSDISVPFHLVVPASMSNEKFSELRKILVKAGESALVRNTYNPDVCNPGALTDDNIHSWYRAQVEQWRRLSSGVKLEK